MCSNRTPYPGFRNEVGWNKCLGALSWVAKGMEPSVTSCSSFQISFVFTEHEVLGTEGEPNASVVVANGMPSNIKK